MVHVNHKAGGGGRAPHRSAPVGVRRHHAAIKKTNTTPSSVPHCFRAEGH